MYTVIKQKRKTISLIIDEDLKVIVKAPYQLSNKQIDDFVNEHQLWIEKNRQIKQKQQQMNWLYTKKIRYLGEEKNIKIVNHPKKDSIQDINNSLVVETKQPQDIAYIRQLMTCYLKQKMYEQCVALSDAYCKQLGCNYEKITIRKQKTRWGSCSSKGHLAYNVRLITAPKEVIAYVVLHEVMHLKHFNHSKLFWEEIEQVMPNYRQYRAYLKENGAYLDF